MVGAVALAFWGPAFARTDGVWPAPLDDVYIHFAYARSLADGYPLEWMPGNGYSSGNTSLVYPVLLAPGPLLGLRGVWLGAWAAALAVGCLTYASYRLGRDLKEAGAPSWSRAAAPLLLLAIPLLDWSLFSGMEVAVLAFVLVMTTLAARRAAMAPAHVRASTQWRFGVWAAVLFLTRPEAAAIGGCLSLFVAYHARALGGLASLLRGAGPMALAVVLQAAVNHALTGETSAAGAVRKLVFTDPYPAPTDHGIAMFKNLLILWTTGFSVELGGELARLGLVGLVLGGLAMRRTRGLSLALSIGAFLCLVIVCTNATAPYQNFRYLAPSLLALLIAAYAGWAELVRRSGARLVGMALVAWAIVGPASRFPRQVEHFAQASRNIAEQQVAVGQRLDRELPADAVVFVGDAGAIPYLAQRRAIDGLGLGGTQGLPFARASVHGVDAVVELLERLPPQDRPTTMAIYRSWWPGFERFGDERFSVTIEGNVICGDATKTVFDADWSSLAPPEESGWGEAIDVADLVSEKEAGYRFPAPSAGWVTSAVRRTVSDGVARFDAGRIIPPGRQERLAVRRHEGPAELWLRTDEAAALSVTVRRDELVVSTTSIHVEPPDEGFWAHASAQLGTVSPGDELVIEAGASGFRSFHYGLGAPGTSSLAPR